MAHGARNVNSFSLVLLVPAKATSHGASSGCTSPAQWGEILERFLLPIPRAFLQETSTAAVHLSSPCKQSHCKMPALPRAWYCPWSLRPKHTPGHTCHKPLNPPCQTRQSLWPMLSPWSCSQTMQWHLKEIASSPSLAAAADFHGAVPGRGGRSFSCSMLGPAQAAAQLFGLSRA